MSLLDRVKPGISRRVDFALRQNKVALLIIDVQQYFTYPEHTYFHTVAFPRAMKCIEVMAQQFRAVRDTPTRSSSSINTTTGCEVIFTYVQSSTKDGRDISLDYKLSGPMLANIPRIGDTDIFVSDCTPDPHTGKGDILLPKTSCSVFQSTNLDYLLRNLGIEQIVVCGQLTDECVESTVRDGADLGYLMTVPEDACAAISPERHKIGLQGMQGFCRILKTAHITWEIAESVDEYNNHHSDTISLEVLTTFLKGRGFADAAIEVASAFSAGKNTKGSKKTTVAAVHDDPTNDDSGSHEDVVTVSSVVMDNIVRQQKSADKSRNSGGDGVNSKSSSHLSPRASSTSPSAAGDNQNEAATPPTRNYSTKNNENSSNCNTMNEPQRGRDPSELITPELNHRSMSSSNSSSSHNNNNHSSTSMNSSQYHHLRTKNSNIGDTKTTTNTSSSNRTLPLRAPASAVTSSSTASIDDSTRTFIVFQQRTNSVSGPIDLDDDSTVAKNGNNNTNNINHRKSNVDPPAVAIEKTTTTTTSTNELVEL